ncbi:MAG TPA: glycosyltransferase family 2 protein [Thermoanaerobaculia bacterium]|nr:glycosyltransferase family 2 protein [Thermoanaerobaculia bacterium]
MPSMVASTSDRTLAPRPDAVEGRPRVSLFFPVYRDESTVERVTRKSIRVLEELASDHEVLIVDDGSPDRAGDVADELARELPNVRVIHHERNLGYGAALRTGFRAARHEWIAFTDGDDEYEVDDLRKLLRLRDRYDLVITFRYAKRYSNLRIFISFVYNKLLRRVFQTRFRDVSCGLRLIRKEIADELELQSTSPFIGAEIAIKTMLKGFRIGEVGIQTFPRQFGRGASTSPRNIWATIVDMRRVYRAVFSPEYDRPLNRD